jgi:hypothetical protein
MQSIGGHLSRRMLERHFHVWMEAKREVLEELEVRRI